MKNVRLLKISLTILFSLGVLSCAKLPPKPDGILCIMHIVEDENGSVDVASSKAVCAPMGDVKSIEDLSEFERKTVVFDSPTRIDVPLANLDSFVTVPPDSWGNIVSYISSLKGIIERNCQ